MRLSAKATINLLKETAAAWSGDYAPSMGAALSYYSSAWPSLPAWHLPRQNPRWASTGPL